MERRAEVSVEARQGENSFRSSVSREGEYRIANLGAGDWTVTAEDYEHHCAAARITLEPGEKETVLDLTASSSVEIQGTVLAPDGNPVEGAKVTLRNADKEAPPAWGSMRRRPAPAPKEPSRSGSRGAILRGGGREGLRPHRPQIAADDRGPPDGEGGDPARARQQPQRPAPRPAFGRGGKRRKRHGRIALP